MSAKATHLFARGRAPRWQPAPERTSIRVPETSIEQQLALLAPDPHTPSGPTAVETASDVTETPVYVIGPQTRTANQRQRLRHANELLRTFTKSA